MQFVIWHLQFDLGIFWCWGIKRGSLSVSHLCDVRRQGVKEYVALFYNRNYASLSSELHCQPATKWSKLVDEIYGKDFSYISTSKLDAYLNEPVLNNRPNFDLLDYWRVHSNRFPNLSRMARDYLVVPGTSTPSERSFSGGRQLITDFRCSLKAETITACMLLKHWFEQPEDVYT